MTGSSSIAPTELPQMGQKARLERGEDRHMAGVPPGPIHKTRSRGNSTHAAVSAPVCRWHILQEQVCGFDVGPIARKRMFAQRHPPSKLDVFVGFATRCLASVPVMLASPA